MSVWSSYRVYLIIVFIELADRVLDALNPPSTTRPETQVITMPATGYATFYPLIIYYLLWSLYYAAYFVVMMHYWQEVLKVMGILFPTTRISASNSQLPLEPLANSDIPLVVIIDLLLLENMVEKPMIHK